MSLNVKLFSKIAKYATQAVHGNVHKELINVTKLVMNLKIK